MPFRFGNCSDCGFLTSVTSVERLCETCESCRNRKVLVSVMEKELMKKFNKVIWIAASFALVSLFVLSLMLRSQ